VVPAEYMKIVVVFGVYTRMRPVAECVVHILNILLVLASFGHDSCCICPFVTLIVPCLFWS
jgi:hypothetical protein